MIHLMHRFDVSTVCQNVRACLNTPKGFSVLHLYDSHGVIQCQKNRTTICARAYNIMFIIPGCGMVVNSFSCFHFSVLKGECIANGIVYDIMKPSLATRDKKWRNDKRRTFIYMYQTGAFFGERRMDNGDHQTTRFNTCVMCHSN